MSFRTLLSLLVSGVCIFLPQAASAASLYLDPAIGTYGPGDTFIETIRLNNEGDCVNAANVALSYPKESLRAVDFSRGDSIFSLWAVEPLIDTDRGTVVFAGGIPGGYCGRIAGDAALSNVLGKVIFTVISATSKNASIQFSTSSAVYLNDGLGTLAKLTTKSSTIGLQSVPTLSKNQWLDVVKDDTTPPQPFDVQVESTGGVFNGRYYIVFSTTDKESGLDHFEIYENGAWKKITTPYLLKTQSLLGVGDIQVRAIDKAGNVRVGTYTAALTPKRHLSTSDFMPFIILAIALFLMGIKIYHDHRKTRKNTPTA